MTLRVQATLCFPIVDDEVYTNSDASLIFVVFMLVGIGQVLLNLLIAAVVNSRECLAGHFSKWSHISDPFILFGIFGSP